MRYVQRSCTEPLPDCDAVAAHGIDGQQAFAHFASWAHEDFYPPLITELRLLTEAGFAGPECFWREAAAAGFGAMKHGLR